MKQYVFLSAFVPGSLCFGLARKGPSKLLICLGTGSDCVRYRRLPGYQEFSRFFVKTGGYEGCLNPLLSMSQRQGSVNSGYFKGIRLGWECSSLIEQLVSMYKALDSLPSASLLTYTQK